jgi:vancomycin resistance protein YoaR
MLRGSYRLTAEGKILIFQMLLFSIATASGLTWKTYISNKQWDNLLHSGVQVSGAHLKSRSIKEDKALIKAQYIDPLMQKSITIEANDKVYSLSYSKLIKEYAIESEFIKSSDLYEKLSLYEKSRILEKELSEIYKVNLSYDENYIEDNITAIKKDLEREAVNASIQSIGYESIKINPAAKGYKLDEEKLERDIKEKINYNSDIKIKAPIIESEAAISTDAISSINAKVSSFKTSFASSSKERSNNIELAAKFVNGTLLLPGEIFSFNESVGERTTDRGFMMAPVVVAGEIDSGIGGGICQVSSTLYNAILRTGIKPLERINHSLPSSYVNMGLDATVNWNNIDFKFENTLKYPLYIEAYTQDKNLFINIYTNSSLLNRKYVVSSKVYKTIQPEMKIVKVSNLSVGKTSTVKEPRNGYLVRVTRDTYENEMLIASEVISDDKYPAIQGIIRIGGK